MKFIRKYVKDIFYGANDGIVTTFAIVAGAVGASLDTGIILILGFAGLVADAFSMAASNYLGTRSEQEVAVMDGEEPDGSLYIPAILTFVSFIVAGSFPLLPYVFSIAGGFVMAAVVTGITLFLIGALLGHFVLHRNWFIWGVEMLAAGGVASVIAFFIGRIVGQFIGA